MTYKKKRRTKAQIDWLKKVIIEVAKEYRPMSVRQLFYRLVVRGLIDKTQNEYKNTVVRLVRELRLQGRLPWTWITDSTRLMRKPDSYHSLEMMLEDSQQLYRRDLWRDQDSYVEIWCESDSAAGTLVNATWDWDVPLMSARGFSSLTFLYGAARTILDEYNRGKWPHIYYFGDHDPSGIAIDRSIIGSLYNFTTSLSIDKSILLKAFPEYETAERIPDVISDHVASMNEDRDEDDDDWLTDEYMSGRFECEYFTFERVGVTKRQIIDMDLPSTPPKRSDSRSKNFHGQAVELEAIDPNVLRELCEECITQHIDQERLERTRSVEAAEKETLASVITSLGA